MAAEVESPVLDVSCKTQLPFVIPHPEPPFNQHKSTHCSTSQVAEPAWGCDCRCADGVGGHVKLPGPGHHHLPKHF
jgi:hypothetical protein